MRFLRSKYGIVAIAVVAVAAGAIGAYAYFTTTGSGTGTATVGTSSNLTLHGNAPTTLYPGTSSTVTFTVDNPSPGHQQLGTIYLAGVHACVGAGSSWTGSSCTSGGVHATTCESVDPGNAIDANASQFYMADVVSNQDFPSGNGQAVTATGTLKFHNLAASQDQCKNANLVLDFATR